MKCIYIFLISIILFSACKNEGGGLGDTEIAKLEEAVKKDAKNLELQDSLLSLILNKFSAETDQNQKVELLQKGLQLAKNFKNETASRTFEMGYVNTLPESKEAGGILLNMAKDLKSAGSDEVAQVLLTGLAKNHTHLKSEAEKLLDPNIEKNVDSLIKATALKIFPTDNPQDMNREALVKYSDLCEAFALTNPKDTMSAEYLFRAAEMARSTNALNKAMALYDMILDRFPNHTRAKSSLFIKGYIYDTVVKDVAKAKEFYNLFLSKYPQDDLANDVKALLENVGKSDEEMLESIKRKQVK